jgi:hypothetical protein
MSWTCISLIFGCSSSFFKSLGHDLSKIQSETENKKITRDGTNFSLTGKKLEEQPKIREIHVHDMVYHMFHLSEILSGPLIIHDLSPAF